MHFDVSLTSDIVNMTMEGHLSRGGMLEFMVSLLVYWTSSIWYFMKNYSFFVRGWAPFSQDFSGITNGIDLKLGMSV